MFFKVVKKPKTLQKLASDISETSEILSSKARLGVIKDQVNTPMYLWHTNSGSIPNLIKSNQNLIDTNLIQLSLADIYHLKEAFQAYYEHLSKSDDVGSEPLHKINAHKQYLCFNDGEETKDQKSLTFMTMSVAGQDSIDGTIKKDINDSIMELRQADSLFKITHKDYIDFVNNLNPDIFITPSSSISSTTSKKKREKAVKGSRELISESLCSTVQPFDTEDQNAPRMLVTVSIEESYKQISDILYEKIETYQDKIAGYFFNVFSLQSNTRESIFNQFCTKYPDDEKLKAIEGDGSFGYVFENLILNGIDIFEAKYPFSLVDKHLALNISTEMPEESKADSLNRQDFKRSANTIDLSQNEFQNDSDRLNNDCEWTACQTINRAYIYHLIDCKEMNAEILLTIHNCYKYEQFFKEVRKHIENDTLIEYASWFMKTQCN